MNFVTLSSRSRRTLLGTEVVVDLTERHTGFGRHISGGHAGVTLLTQHFFAASSSTILVSIFLGIARIIKVLDPFSDQRVDKHQRSQPRLRSVLESAVPWQIVPGTAGLLTAGLRAPC